MVGTPNWAKPNATARVPEDTYKMMKYDQVSVLTLSLSRFHCIEKKHWDQNAVTETETPIKILVSPLSDCFVLIFLKLCLFCIEHQYCTK